MATVFEKIKELRQFGAMSKHEQLVDGLINAIDNHLLEKGDQLPSINKMAEEIGYARKTVAKAYEDLKARGLVESKNYVGYFVASTATAQRLKVALLLYAFHTFQEAFYNALRTELPAEAQVDVFFHHNNPDIFSTIIENIAGRYGKYVVAPIESAESRAILKKIPTQNLVIADRHVSLGTKCAYVTQEFERSTADTLRTLRSKIKRFDRFVLFFREDSDYPKGVKNAFLNFVTAEGIPHKIAKTYQTRHLEKGSAYLLINDHELWDLLKDCKSRGLTPGTDIGILSHNDSSAKELVEGGITTFSTDFKEMGRQVARCLMNGRAVKQTIPTNLIQRQTL